MARTAARVFPAPEAWPLTRKAMSCIRAGNNTIRELQPARHRIGWQAPSPAWREVPAVPMAPDEPAVLQSFGHHGGRRGQPLCGGHGQWNYSGNHTCRPRLGGQHHFRSGGKSRQRRRPGDQCPVQYPEGVAVDTSGNLFVADEGDDTIREIMPVGTNWASGTLTSFGRFLRS